MSHTPGPWFVSMKPDWDEDGWMGVGVYDCDGGVYAVVDDEPETIARPFCEADARLIAAAPEMLEKIKRLEAEKAESEHALGFAVDAVERLEVEKAEMLEALEYAIAQVPELASVPGIESAIRKARGEE